jgi:hypothetical protein
MERVLRGQTRGANCHLGVMMKTIRLMLVLVGLGLAATSAPANAAESVQVSSAWAFQDWFPYDARELGPGKFEGMRFQLGIKFTAEGVYRVEATNVTLSTPENPVVFDVPPLEGIPGYHSAFNMMATLVPEHLGHYRFVAYDEDDNVLAVDEQRSYLHYSFHMPQVRDVWVSGDPLLPTVTWVDALDHHVPDFCGAVGGRVRLLKNADEQLCISEWNATWQGITGPERTVTFEEAECEVLPARRDLKDLWVRVENMCWANGAEGRSETLIPYLDLLGDYGDDDDDDD